MCRYYYHTKWASTHRLGRTVSISTNGENRKDEPVRFCENESEPKLASKLVHDKLSYVLLRVDATRLWLKSGDSLWESISESSEAEGRASCGPIFVGCVPKVYKA